MVPILFLEIATEELKTAFLYLEQQETNLGKKFIKKTDEYLIILQKNPFIFADDYNGIRQVRVVPFSYIIRYKVFKKYIAVVQIYHSKQSPKIKRSL